MRISQLRGRITDYWFVVAILGLLVVYNLSGLWLQGTSRAILEASISVVAAALCYFKPTTLRQLSLQRAGVTNGLRWGLACVVVIGLVLGAVYLIHPQTFIDSRYHVSWLRAFIVMMIIIPLQTVVFEEFMFRGALLAGLRQLTRDRWAIVLSAVAFGLWHIVPSLHIATSSQALANTGAHTPNAQVSAIVLTVCATTVAGVFLAWLRLKSTSLIAPILTHWAINALSVLFVVLAHARLS